MVFAGDHVQMTSLQSCSYRLGSSLSDIIHLPAYCLSCQFSTRDPLGQSSTPAPPGFASPLTLSGFLNSSGSAKLREPEHSSHHVRGVLDSSLSGQCPASRSVACLFSPAWRLFVFSLLALTARFLQKATKADVQAHFEQHGTGEITDIKLMSGFGFIEYKDAMDARDVVPGRFSWTATDRIAADANVLCYLS